MSDEEERGGPRRPGGFDPIRPGTPWKKGRGPWLRHARGPRSSASRAPVCRWSSSLPSDRGRSASPGSRPTRSPCASTLTGAEQVITRPGYQFYVPFLMDVYEIDRTQEYRMTGGEYRGDSLAPYLTVRANDGSNSGSTS